MLASGLLSLPLYYGLLPERPEVNSASWIEEKKSNIDEKVRLQLEEITASFHQELFQQRNFIHTVSQKYNVAEEALLAAGYVEYVRMHTSDASDLMHSREGVRTYVKSLLTSSKMGEWVTKNVMRRSIGYGHVHSDTLEDVGGHPLFHTFEHLHGQTDLEQQIINVAEVLRLHQEIWHDAGYDIERYPFKTIRTHEERIALQVTLYNGFGAKGGTPKDDPKLGGTYIPYLQMTFSDLTQVYVSTYFKKWNN